MAEPNKDYHGMDSSGMDRRNFLKKTAFVLGATSLAGGVLEALESIVGNDKKGVFGSPSAEAAEAAGAPEGGLDDILYKKDPVLRLRVEVHSENPRQTSNYKTGKENIEHRFNIGATSFTEKDGVKTPKYLEVSYRDAANMFSSGLFTESQKKAIYDEAERGIINAPSKSCEDWQIPIGEDQAKYLLMAGGYLTRAGDGKLLDNPNKPLHHRSGRDRPHASQIFTREEGYSPNEKARCENRAGETKYIPAFTIQAYYRR